MISCYPIKQPKDKQSMTAQKISCSTCGEDIPSMRLEFLLAEGYKPEACTCIKHSTVRKVAAFFIQPTSGQAEGEVDTSELMICSKVYNDSVRQVFRRAAEDEDGQVDSSEGDLDVSTD